MTTPRQYELVYIVHPDVAESGITDLHAQIDAVVARFEGQIEKTENWGRRRLAYEIARQREGTYVLEVITGPAELMRELDRRLRVMDQVMRHLVVRVDDDLRKAERARSRRKSTQHRRRTARGLPPEPEPSEAAGAAERGEPRERLEESEVQE